MSKRCQEFRLFKLAELIDSLNFNSGISSGPYKSYSLLLPTDKLFELACKSEIDRLLHTETEFYLEKSFSKTVSKDSNNTIRPDIVIKNKNGDFIKMGDCKYSENNANKLKHLYQLNTYMDACQHYKSFILHPSKIDKTNNKKSYELDWGHTIDIINIPIDNYHNFSSSLKELLSDVWRASSHKKMAKSTPNTVEISDYVNQEADNCNAEKSKFYF